VYEGEERTYRTERGWGSRTSGNPGCGVGDQIVWGSIRSDNNRESNSSGDELHLTAEGFRKLLTIGRTEGVSVMERGAKHRSFVSAGITIDAVQSTKEPSRFLAIGGGREGKSADGGDPGENADSQTERNRFLKLNLNLQYRKGRGRGALRAGKSIKWLLKTGKESHLLLVGGAPALAQSSVVGVKPRDAS